MLPPEAQDHERVRAQLTWALNAMNSAMEGVPLQYAQPQPQPAVGAGYAYAGAAGVSHFPLPVVGRALGQGLAQWQPVAEAGSATSAAEMQSHVKSTQTGNASLPAQES